MLAAVDFIEDGFRFYSFDPASAPQFQAIARLIDVHLSEPYSLYVYWYFFHEWPQYCFLVSTVGSLDIVGVVISKVEPHRAVRVRGYIGMLVIDPAFRGQGLAKKLVQLSIRKMVEWDHVDEIMLETEVDNLAALHLYELFGFLRTKRMHRYYLNGSDAFRLILPVLEKLGTRIAFLAPLDTSGKPGSACAVDSARC
ncbi:acyl-CoA N-acyltransferase [Metschnikowia bicuspidata var. bicuspidata NRRL YB-4993]|uniref:Acyl-CoA N-acyltransferase n=1 Tax=Metschnikowia bicuspidata var. bicuspidata NRRL YB-4993 TaxID=869754 RepID=A0A1A0HGD0_9ASCO|nr:acyl-CoA N-acyltransferase [Metschnikowia bicuspidata var. bicuspidata NRRL YB-4993]OBA22937.1 acyl-CoA N-acyltransferase [Metschnikowia bicuspidata var. bicuspidata NRRL YB-4993]